MKNILVSIHYNTYYESLLGVVNALREEGKYRLYANFPLVYDTLPQHLQQLTALGVRCFDKEGNLFDSKALPVTFAKVQKHKNIENKFKKIIPCFNVLKDLRLAYRFFFSTRKRLKQIQIFLKREKIDLVVLGGNPVATDTSWMIEAAHREGIKAIALVNWLGHYEGSTMYMANPEHATSTPMGWVVQLFFKKWIYCGKEKKISRIPPFQVLPLELMGLAPKHPWVLHSGELDAIGVEGETMRRNAISMGLAANKIYATGAVFHDEIYEILKTRTERKEKLYHEMGLSIGKPMMLVAIPPDFLYPINGFPQCPQCDFKDYGMMIDFWAKTVSLASNFNVVVSLHPATAREDIAFIEESGIRIANQKTSHLIPLADVYVACVSATIGIAIACGVPVINYDIYRFHYADYTHFKGVVLVHESTEFQDVIKRVNIDKLYLEEVRQLQVSQAKDYALVDGKAAQRIISLVEKNL